MTLKTRNHALICLEDKYYSRTVLLNGARLAKKNGYTFEVVFFYAANNKHAIFHLLNIAESKNLSAKLGATQFSIMRTKNEQTTSKEIVAIARYNQAKEIIMSGSQQQSKRKIPFLIRNFVFDKFNYISNHLPDVVLNLIHHHVYNPFEKGQYKNGTNSYLVKNSSRYILSDKPAGGRHIAGLFFQRKDTDDRSGIFTFISNARVIYMHIHEGKTGMKNAHKWLTLPKQK